MPTLSKPLKYKIAILFDDSLDRPDGVQQYIVTLGAWLSAQGHEVHYIASQTVRTDIPNTHSIGRNVRVKFNGNSMAIPLPVSRRCIRGLLEREKFDIIHVQAPFSPWLSGRVIRAADARTVVVGTFHILPQSTLEALASRGLWFWTRRVWRRLDALFAVSPEAGKFALTVFRAKSKVIPNVFEYDRFAVPSSRTSGPVRMLYLGRLVPRKGCQLLLNALTKLDPRLDYHLEIYGKGPLLPTLQSFVQSRDLVDKVSFEGFVSEDDKPLAYANADISIFPSTGGESFGIVLIEAMASGSAAVLAGNNPGYSSVVTRPDLLFDPGDANELATKLTRLITDPETRLEAATWGKEHARQYDVDIVGRRIVSEYERLCEQKNMQ